jgi:seryl-tRNA synthetase
LEEQIKAQDKKATEVEESLNVLVKGVGNLVHPSVPISLTEDDNSIATTWAPEGFDKTKRASLSHHTILAALDGYDPDRGTKLVGHRGYVLKNWGVFLTQALMLYGQDFLADKGFDVVQPPSFLNSDLMAATSQLSDFAETLYGIHEDLKSTEATKYLIATSEQPISAMHSKEILTKQDLPIRYAGTRFV